jgi:DNA methylase
MTDSSLDALSMPAPAPTRSSRRGSAPSPLLEQVRAFRLFGQPTIEAHDGAIRYLVNEFWSAGQRQAHSLHEVSYRACFKPQLPAFFIERLTRPGDSVYDPFMGRGTTPLQAALMGRRPVGNDVNPLSVLLTRPRLDAPTLEAVARRLEDVPWDAGEIDNEDLLAFYSPRTLQRLSALRNWLINEAPPDAAAATVDDWIRMVALNRLTGHSPGFFSVYTLPPNQATSAAAQRKINAKRGQSPPDRDIARLILKKSAALLSDGPIAAHPAPLLSTGLAEATHFIATGSIALVVTSPPFLDIVQYAQDNWLRSWFAGIDAASVAIAHHRSEAGWREMVRATLAELARIVAAGGHVAFEVGEVRDGRVLLERLVWDAAEGLPFDRLFVMVNQQQFTKTANCWGVRNNAKGTNSNRIVVLRRR